MIKKPTDSKIKGPTVQNCVGKGGSGGSGGSWKDFYCPVLNNGLPKLLPGAESES